MSLQQVSTSHARVKSLRAPNKSSLTAAQPKSSTAIPITSHVSLFLTNLRLLDLDQESDWPDISPSTFSSKDAAGGQKRRIQSVEWALYRLFLLWDPDEARNKLKPFYPPLDQVQSVNLRAALLRGLEQAKRNGVLGRDAVVRKTMLDECKGERLEEVLAVFSSAVLKKLVAERALNCGTEYRPTISETIALENWGYSGERTELNGLLLAHKVSLASALAKKNAARVRYQDFAELLQLKQRNLARRQEAVKAAAQRKASNTVPNHLRKQTRQALKTNWTGNDQWIGTILHDDSGSSQGGLLAAEFEDVWAGVKHGRLSDLEDKSTGLLEQLDQRVRLQRSRLERWQSFRKSFFGNTPTQRSAKATENKSQVRGVDLGFTAHRDLRQGFIEVEDSADSKISDNPKYHDIITSLRSELEEIGKPRIPDLSKLCRPQGDKLSQGLAPPSTATEPISDLSEWEDEPDEESRPDSKTAIAQNSKTIPGSSTQVNQPRVLKRPVVRSNGTDERNGPGKATNDPHQPVSQKLESAPQSHQENLPARQRLRKKPSDDNPHEHGRKDGNLPTQAKSARAPKPNNEAEMEAKPQQPRRPISPTQAAADQILASMTNASPSPTKKARHMLSLAERTRLTMSRTKSFDAEDEIDDNLLSPSVARSMRKAAATPVSLADSVDEEPDDLIARTRKSMVGFEAAKQKAQLERRRSERKSRATHRKDSHFPRVEEETINDGSIMEELLEAQQDDMDAVFKSRPKMRVSPVPSPGRMYDSEHEI